MDIDIIEQDLPSWDSLKIRDPFDPTVREKSTPTVMMLDDDKRLIGLDGYIFNKWGIERITRNVKDFSDVVDYILDAGTVYLSCSHRWFHIMLEALGHEDYFTLTFKHDDGSPMWWKGCTIRARKGYITIRKGNRYGRVYSLWPEYSQDTFKKLNEMNPSPISLDDLHSVFGRILLRCMEEGVPLDTLCSAGSIAQNMLLNECSCMFGHLNTVDSIHIERSHQGYKGGRFEAAESGLISKYGYSYDIKSAYPSEIAKCIRPFPPYTNWIDDPHYHPEAFYAVARCLLTPDPNLLYSPAVIRYFTNQFTTHSRLIVANTTQEVWLTKPEIDMILRNGWGTLDILYGSWGIPGTSSLSFPARPLMERLYNLRSDPTLGRLVKAVSQTVNGKLGSVYLESYDIVDHKIVEHMTTSPVFLLPVAAHVNGSCRARILEMSMLGAAAIRTDQVIFKERHPELVDDRFGGVSETAGLQFVMDDILANAKYLPLLSQGNPKDTEILVDQDEALTGMKAITEYGVNWFKHLGDLKLQKSRRLGSKKRVLKEVPTKENLLKGSISSDTPKTSSQLEEIYSKIEEIEQ